MRGIPNKPGRLLLVEERGGERAFEELLPLGKIILNPELIKAPKGCIEYVIVHELCHLVYHEHTQRFFDLQTKEMGSWEKWKGRLERVMA